MSARDTEQMTNDYSATIHARDGGSNCGAALEERVAVLVENVRAHFGFAVRVMSG